MISDFLIVVYSALVWIIFIFLYNSFSAQVKSIINDLELLSNMGSFWLQVLLVVEIFAVFVFSYILLVAGFSLLNGYYWMKASKNSLTFRRFFAFFKMNLLWSFSFLLLAVLINLMLKEPYWPIIVLLLMVIFPLALPNMHVLYSLGKVKNTFALLRRSFSIFISGFRDMGMVWLVILLVVSVLGSISRIFMLFPGWMEQTLLFILTLFVLSWIKRYVFAIVRSIEK